MCNTMLGKNKTIKQNSLKGDTEFMVDSLNSESKLHQEENVYLRFCNWNNQLCTLLSETNLIKGKQNKKEKDDKYKFSFPFYNLKYFTILNPCVNTRTEYIKIRTDNKLL